MSVALTFVCGWWFIKALPSMKRREYDLSGEANAKLLRLGPGSTGFIINLFVFMLVLDLILYAASAMDWGPLFITLGCAFAVGLLIYHWILRPEIFALYDDFFEIRQRGKLKRKIKYADVTRVKHWKTYSDFGDDALLYIKDVKRPVSLRNYKPLPLFRKIRAVNPAARIDKSLLKEQPLPRKGERSGVKVLMVVDIVLIYFFWRLLLKHLIG